MIRVLFDCDSGNEVTAVPGFADRLRNAVETAHIQIVAPKTELAADVFVTRDKAAPSARARTDGTSLVIWDFGQLRRYLDSVGL